MTNEDVIGLEAVSPGLLGIACPDCGGPLQSVGTQYGTMPGPDEAHGRYEMYYCENNANTAEGEVANDPEALCHGSVKVYENGMVSVGGEAGHELQDHTDLVDEARATK